MGRTGNCEMMREATEMSATSTLMPAGSVNFLMMGTSAYAARAGASSVLVHMILAEEA